MGKACHELRIVDKTKTWRIIDALHSQAIVVLHVFQKSTLQTPKAAIELSKARLKEFKDTVESEEKESIMSQTLKKKLRNTDWQIGNAEDILQLSNEKSALIDLRLALSQAAKRLRIKQDLSQAELAQRMKSSQSRIAKIEAADPSVSIDLMVKALVAAGAGRREIAQALR
jgi:DNA-binding XRE family transcriptional regulator